LGRWAAAIAKTKGVVHTVHGWSFHNFQNPIPRKFYTILERLSARSTDRLKEGKEYQGQLIQIKAGMDGLKQTNPNYYEDGCLALELCNSLYPRHVKADLQEKAKIANLVASNYTLVDVSLVPKRRRPFSIFAERPSSTRWLPLARNFHNWLLFEA